MSGTHRSKSTTSTATSAYPQTSRSSLASHWRPAAISEFVREKYNREVTEFFADEGISGTHAVLDRPASRDMTDVIDRHDVVICTRLDRLSRSSSDLLGLIWCCKTLELPCISVSSLVRCRLSTQTQANRRAWTLN